MMGQTSSSSLPVRIYRATSYVQLPTPLQSLLTSLQSAVFGLSISVSNMEAILPRRLVAPKISGLNVSLQHVTAMLSHPCIALLLLPMCESGATMGSVLTTDQERYDAQVYMGVDTRSSSISRVMRRFVQIATCRLVYSHGVRL